jgi:hypothetical protein
MTALVLPQLAYLPETLDRLDELIALLDRALEPARRFKRVRDDRENDLRLAVALHALNALGQARAVRLLAEQGMGHAIYAPVRTIFESLVKIRWIRRDPGRATSYLDAEPFARYVLATSRVKKAPAFKRIVQECENAVTAKPGLLKLPNATNKNGKANFRAIAMALRMPNLEVMAAAVGMDEEILLLDAAVPSLSPHGDVIYTRNFAKGLNADGSFTLSYEADPGMLQAYAARALAHVGCIVEDLAMHVFPDGAIQFEAEELLQKRMNPLLEKLRSSVPQWAQSK